MKTLKQHVILYDEVCPMCNLYTSAFIKTGMLDKEGRQPYQQMHGDLKKLVDKEWAVNEIALVDKATGQVYYGIQSLMLIIAHSFPVLKPLFRCKPFLWIAQKAYHFISYNRRVIVPAAVDANDHQPAFVFKYRMLYLLSTWLVTAFILYKYSSHLEGLLPASNLYREALICGGQIVWQGSIVSFTNRAKMWDYLGNMMTISFAGALLLLAGMGILKSLAITSPVVFAVYFFSAAALMFLEHMRRSKLLGLGFLLTATWVLYRIALLLIIL